MTYFYRRIFKSQLTGTATTRELLQTMFVGEMLQVAATLWIVSPWISNVVLIDNRSGNFDSLNPEWGRREIRLADTLIALMSRGSKVVIVTRNQESNMTFITHLRNLAEHHALDDQVIVKIHNLLHTKGILLSRSLLIGSMNLTYNGLEMNDEWIEFSTDPEDVARTRLEFATYLEVR